MNRLKCERNCDYSVAGECRLLELMRDGATEATACDSPAKVLWGLESDGIKPKKEMV